MIYNGLIETIDQPGLGPIRQSRPAARFSRHAGRDPGARPSIGQHTGAILAELGFAPSEIAALVASGAAAMGKQQP